jgi:hypothetical protein
MLLKIKMFQKYSKPCLTACRTHCKWRRGEGGTVNKTQFVPKIQYALKGCLR